ncbi:hypothetical protein AB6A40_005581 [Gnathostoma spinigerum]|uniref:Uncharacterized protein n=1 Tax=Gnathostoma spinigerum TaxID=75299 RepID=A0ABD6EQB9_9BILA
MSHLVTDQGTDPTEVEIERGLRQNASYLSEAHCLKEKANFYYSKCDYAEAIKLYHQCLLQAKAVRQLSQVSLQRMARLEQENRDSDKVSPSQTSNPDDVAGTEEAAVPVAGRSRLSSTSRGEDMKAEANEIITKCYNNLAACILKGSSRTVDDYMRAIAYCDKVLEADENNEKALFRKAMLYMKCENYERALLLFKKLPDNREAASLAAKCDANIIKDRKRRNEIIRRNFARAAARETIQQEAQNAGAAQPSEPVAMNGNASVSSFAEL